jgi:fumarate hydratase class II
LLVLEQEHLTAFGAGIEQLLDAEFLAAAQAAVHQTGSGSGQNVVSNEFGKVFGFHGAITSIPPM